MLQTEYQDNRERLIEVVRGADEKECSTILAALMKKRLADPAVRSVAAHPRIGRNDKCPCGSGHKFKKCCIRKVV